MGRACSTRGWVCAERVLGAIKQKRGRDHLWRTTSYSGRGWWCFQSGILHWVRVISLRYHDGVSAFGLAFLCWRSARGIGDGLSGRRPALQDKKEFSANEGSRCTQNTQMV